MLGIYNPEIPVQSAAPISVLLDNLAVPSEARSRSICFPRSCSPGTGMRLASFPACAMAARAAGSLCCCASKETGQELWTGHLAARTCEGRGGWSPSGQAGFVLGLKMSAGHTCNLGKGFQKRKWGQGLLGWRSGKNTGQPQILVRNKRQKPTDRLFSLVVSRGCRSRAGVFGGRRGPA